MGGGGQNNEYRGVGSSLNVGGGGQNNEYRGVGSSLNVGGGGGGEGGGQNNESRGVGSLLNVEEAKYWIQGCRKLGQILSQINKFCVWQDTKLLNFCNWNVLLPKATPPPPPPPPTQKSRRAFGLRSTPSP